MQQQNLTAAKRIDIYEKQIKATNIGMVSKISHSIAQIMTVEGSFDRKSFIQYIWNCRTAVKEFDLPMPVRKQAMEYLKVKKVEDLVNNDFLIFLTTGFVPGHGGSQINPAILIREDLVMMKGFHQLAEAVRSSVEEDKTVS